MSTSATLITGVSSGIGRVAAEYLLERGTIVYGSVRKEEDILPAARQNPNFHPLVFDVTDRAAAATALEAIDRNGHHLTGLVNNAGIAVSGPVETLAEADYRRQFEVNVFGLITMCQLCLPRLHASREAGAGPVRIVNIGSVSGYLTSPFTTVYSASKFAVEALTDGLRRELLDFGIDVISVAPGPVKTPIWKKGREQTAAFSGRYAPMLERLGPYTEAAEAAGIAPEEVAEAIYRALTADSPKPDVLLMRKAFLPKLLRLFPKRFVDRFFKKRLESNRRY